MSREFIPLLKPPKLPVLLAGIEVMILEACLVEPGAAIAIQTELRCITALVSFDPLPAGRQQLRIFAASLIAAVPSFEQAPKEYDSFDWLVESISERQAASLCVVVSLPNHSSDIERTLVAVIRNLRDARHHVIQLVVAIAQNPADWAGCVGIDGFVIATEHRDDAAFQMVSMASSLIAPGFLCPIDAEDLSQVIGTPDTPSQFIQAVWFTTTNQLLLSSPEALAVLSKAQMVAVMPATVLRLGSPALLIKAVSAQVLADCNLFIVATYGLVNTPQCAIVPVSLLCRMRQLPSG